MVNNTVVVLTLHARCAAFCWCVNEIKRYSVHIMYMIYDDICMYACHCCMDALLIHGCIDE